MTYAAMMAVVTLTGKSCLPRCIYKSLNFAVSVGVFDGAIVAGAVCKLPEADMQVCHGELLAFGDAVVHVIGTPGHTQCSVCYRWRDRFFTGDILLLGGCGRAVLPGGDPGCLFDSVTTRLFAKSVILFAANVGCAGNARNQLHSLQRRKN